MLSKFPISQFSSGSLVSRLRAAAIGGASVLASRSVSGPRFPISQFPISQFLVGAFLLFSQAAQAQEALRYSIAGEAAAEARRSQAADPAYTVKSGDFRLLITPSVGLDWNSNVENSPDNPEDDFILRPMLNLGASYPLTQKNLLSVNVGIGYDYYFNHNDLSTWRLNAGSGLDFDLFVGEFLINFHDRFSYTRDSASQSSLAGGNTADFGNFENTAGVLATWDGNDLTASLGYDHLTVISGSGDYESQDRGAEMVVARAGLKLHPEFTAGVEASASFTAYDQAYLNDNNAYTLGAYATWQPGPALNVQPRIGYSIYDFRQTGLFPAEDTDAWYFDITASHKATKALTYSLSVGRQLYPGTQGDVTDKFYVRPSATWSFVKDWSFSTTFSYEKGEQVIFSGLGTSNEKYDWFSAGAGVNHAILKRLSAGLNYRYTYRTSNQADRDYDQHVVSLTLTYQPQ